MKRIPCQTNSKPIGNNREHGTPIGKLLSQDSMRAIGKAYDKGIIKEAS